MPVGRATWPTSGPPGRHFGARARKALVCQLIVLNLEYRRRIGEGEAASTAPIRCRLGDYEPRFPDLGRLPAERRVGLIATEFRAREKRGDELGYEECNAGRLGSRR